MAQPRIPMPRRPPEDWHPESEEPEQADDEWSDETPRWMIEGACIVGLLFILRVVWNSIPRE